MKKVLLIAPLTEEFSGKRNYGDPSLGVHRLASFLKGKSIDVTLYDCNIHDKVPEGNFDIIGISVLNDTLVLSLEWFIKLRKTHPNAFLIAGGAESILNYQEIFDNSDVDAVILGEGEIPIWQLCLEYSPSRIDGIIFRRRGRTVTNDLLWEYYKDFDFRSMGYSQYWEKRKLYTPENMILKTVRLVTSSHCNRKCSFCSVTRMHEFTCGKVVQPAYLEMDKVVILLNRIKDQIPDATKIYFCEDSVFTLRKRTDEFIDALRQCPQFDYLVQTETDKVNEDIIRRLSEVRVNHISFGVENASPRIRKLMNKPQNEQNIDNIIDWCNKYKINPYYLIILFDPNSTMEDLRINYTKINEWMDKGCTVSVEPFMMPYRGATVYNEEFEFDYKVTRLSNGKTLKHPYIIFPKDPEVRKVMDRFRELLPIRIAEMKTKLGVQQESKNLTGKVMIELLGSLI